MERFTRHATFALGLGLGMTLALLFGLSEVEGWVLGGLPAVEAAPAATTRYVATWGDDSGNLCTSPISPCRTVQQATNMAWSGDDEVLVAEGVYTAASGPVLFIPYDVVIQGGYSADFSERDPQAYPTTLDGRGSMRVVHMQGDITPTLEGLRLTNGYVDGHGGGIYSVDAHPLISGCRIFSNTIDNGYGGGAYLSNADNARLIDNEILSNRTNGTSGGGIYLLQSDGITLVGNVIRNNTAFSYGGGVALPQNDVTLTNNTVLENRLLVSFGIGAGIGTGGGSSVRLLHTTIARNSGGGGQGIYAAGSSTVWMTNTVLVSHTLGIETSGGAAVTATHTLWGEGAWANVTDTVGSDISIGAPAVNWHELPGFIDPDGGDYGIGTGSGAIDKGLDAAVTTDIDGDLRPFCGGPDLGADETTCCANLNGTLYPTVQAAVDASTDPGDVVKVAGTCTGVTNRGGNSQTVYISKTVTVRGGYTTADWNTSDPDANPTTLDAARRGRVVYIQGSNDISPTLEGLQVINSSTGGDGGGIYAGHASPIIRGCQIYSNTAMSGGGVALYEVNGAALSNNDIHDNMGRLGAGIRVDNSPSALLCSNAVHHNEATVSGGGGIYMSEGHTSTLSSNDIYANSADEGGGVYLVDTIDATLTGNTIHDNSADDGGGLYMDCCHNITLDNNIIADNQSPGNGGGIYVYGSTVHLRHTTLARNSGQQGVYVYETATARLTDTILVSHTVGVETDFGATAHLTATLWGDGAWANDIDTVGGNIYTGTLNWRGDPGFVDPDGGDYHITVSSEALDRGIATRASTDIDGHPRCVGGAPDLGADEIPMSLEVAKSGPAWANEGSFIVYTISITNNGTVATENVLLTDTLPSSASFVSASDGGSETGGMVSWPTFDVPPGAVVRTFTVTATETITNDDYGATSQGGLAATGSVAVSTHVNHAPTADAGAPQSVHTGAVTLDGSGSSDPDDDALSFQWQQTGGPASVTLDDADTMTATFSAPPTGGIYVFALTITDTYGLADSDTTTVTITLPDMSIAKSGPAEARPGELITYTLVVTNNGSAAATTLVITDMLPSGATFVAASDGGSLVGDTVTWAVSNLEAGQAVTRTFAVTTSATITNNDYRVSCAEMVTATGSASVTTEVAYKVRLPLILRDN